MPNDSAAMPPSDKPSRRLRRLHRIWPGRDGNISYLLTLCVESRACVLANETIFERLAAFLIDSPSRYQWFGRRFVIMPDHIHLIAHMGQDSVPLGQWIKALKAVTGGLERRINSGAVSPPKLTRIKRAWRWQNGFHDHKFRTRESEARKWEYVCLNPVRAGLVKCPEDWPYGGEIFYDEAGNPRLIRATPPLLEKGILIEETRRVRKPGLQNEHYLICRPGAPTGRVRLGRDVYFTSVLQNFSMRSSPFWMFSMPVA
jgi:putative transposase